MLHSDKHAAKTCFQLCRLSRNDCLQKRRRTLAPKKCLGEQMKVSGHHWFARKFSVEVPTWVFAIPDFGVDFLSIGWPRQVESV